MILDSETSLVYLPDDIAEYIASLFVPPATYNTYSGIYTVPCTALAPRVGIITGGTSYFMSEDELMGGKGQGGGGCTVAVQGARGGSLVLGDSWLSGVLVVFDVGGGMEGDGAGWVRVVGREGG